MNTITKVTKTKEIFTPTLFMVSPSLLCGTTPNSSGLLLRYRLWRCEAVAYEQRYKSFWDKGHTLDKTLAEGATGEGSLPTISGMRAVH